MGEVQPATYRCPVCGWTPTMPLNPQDIAEHAKTHNDKTTREYIRRRKL